MYNYMGPGWRLTTTVLSPCVTVVIGLIVLGFRNVLSYWPFFTRKQWIVVVAIIVLAIVLPHFVLYYWWRDIMRPKYLTITLTLAGVSTMITAALTMTLVVLDERLRR